MVTASQARRIANLAETGLTYRQVAAIVGMEHTTVRRCINRLRAKGAIPSAMACRAEYAKRVAAEVMK
jgi:IS30 family transposase